MSKKKDLAAEIKKMEKAKRKEVAAPIPQDTKVTFDSWFHQRVHKISKIHAKEVIMADFSARGVEGECTLEEFDKALKLYGVEL